MVDESRESDQPRLEVAREATSQAIAIMTAMMTEGGPSVFDVIESYDDPRLVLSGLVNLSNALVSTVAHMWGVPPEVVLQRIAVHVHEFVDGQSQL